VWIAAIWAGVSLALSGPVGWLVTALAGAAHMPAAAASRVFVGVVDALVYALVSFAVFTLARAYRPPAWYMFAALAGYLLGQAGYLALGWLVDGGTASLASVDPVLMAVEAVASTLGAAGAVGVWSAQRGTDEGPGV
jgi:hypothetical protein